MIYKENLEKAMRFNIYWAWIFILDNVTLSSSLIQHDRFKRERLSKSYIEEDKLHLDYCYTDDQIVAPKSTTDNIDIKRKCNFFNDVKFMLEYNQNGLMHLLIYLFQLLVLIATIVRSILYTSFSTDRDSSTGQFLNPVLSFAESLLIIDYVHKFDDSGLINRLIALISLEFLIIRIRAFFVRLEIAKINKFRYEQINTVHLDISYASEIRYSFSDYIKALFRLYQHECFKGETLIGERRLPTLYLNNKIRYLDKIDRIYYYNQINFNDCFECADYLSDYREQDRSLNPEKSNIGKRRKISLFRYIFTIDLPGKFNYVAKPEHRLDPIHALCLLLFFIFSTITTTFCVLYISYLVTYIALVEDNSISEDNYLDEQVDWDKLRQFKFLFGLSTYFTMVLVLAANICDTGLLPYCGYLCLSRSNKIVILLQRELRLYRLHLSEFNILYDQYNSIIKIDKDYLDQINTNVRCRLPFKDFIDTVSHTLNLKTSNISQKNSTLYSNRKMSIREGSIIGIKHESSTKIDHNKYGQDLYKVIDIYKNRLLTRSEIKYMNENLEYLMELVEVLQYELQDYKTFFTTTINMHLIFGIVSISVSMSMVLKSTDINSTLLAVMAGSASIFPLLWSLFIGAASELAVSITFEGSPVHPDLITNKLLLKFKNVYRTMSTLMVDELGIFERHLIRRTLKLCQNFGDSHNRSFVIFGNCPLSFGSLTSVSMT